MQALVETISKVSTAAYQASTPGDSAAGGAGPGPESGDGSGGSGAGPAPEGDETVEGEFKEG